MFEVIPNWHPLFVHFSIALLSMSTIFFIALKIMSKHPVEGQLRTLAYWNLWLGTGFAVITAIAGWFAFNSVAHDTPSHAAMTEHRNWALVTLSVYVVISIWSILYFKSERKISMLFTSTMILAFLLLASTGWRGSEVVYRYGLGVMSIPKSEGDGHAHEHSENNNKTSSTKHYEIKIYDSNEEKPSESHISIIDGNTHDKSPHTH